MDIVIPLGKSKTDYLDLRYVLRSIEKFAPAVDTVYIVGEKPKWIQNVKHIQCADDPRKEWKERNIYFKVLTALYITERFLFMNDDHVLLEVVDIENYPNYYKGACYDSMLKNASSYRQTMNQTKKWLAANDYPDISYDGHCPVIIEEERFLDQCVLKSNWNSTEFGYGMKSLYCAGIQDSLYMEDVKISKRVDFAQAAQKCEGRHVISFTDAAIKTGMREYFDTFLGEKSKYEQ